MFNSDFQYLHYWEKRPKGTCVWCSYRLRCQKVLGKVIDKKAKPKRPAGGCIFCNVHLCKEGDCWTRFHSNNVFYS